jgi:hypothetical protein
MGISVRTLTRIRIGIRFMIRVRIIFKGRRENRIMALASHAPVGWNRFGPTIHAG